MLERAIVFSDDELHELLTSTDQVRGGTDLYTARLKLADEKARRILGRPTRRREVGPR